MDVMQAMPRLSVRRIQRPALPRLRWRVFVRVLAGIAVITTITVLAVLLEQRMVGSAVVAGIVGLLASLGGSAVSAMLWSWTVERRVHELIGVIESGSAVRAEQMSGDFFDVLFAELIPAWEDGVNTLQDKWQEKQEEARRSQEALAEMIRMMARAVDERAVYLRGHSERVATYAAAIGRQMGMTEAQSERVRLSGLLHDIGSVGVEDYLVSKEAPLSPEEFEIVKAHTFKGAAILRPVPTLHDLIPGVELHHESLDGLGYPYGLKGDEIPLMARIIAVADSFDAMTTQRPYQAAMNAEYVLEILERLSGTRYDPAVVTALGDLLHSGALEVRNQRVPVSFHMKRPAGELV